MSPGKRITRSKKITESKLEKQEGRDSSEFVTFVYTKQPKKDTFQTTNLFNPKSEETIAYEMALANSSIVSEMAMNDSVNGVATRPTGIFLNMKYREYIRTANPALLIETFLLTHRFGVYPPLWVQTHIADVFSKYSESSGKVSLDKLFGITSGSKGGKRGAAFKKLLLAERDQAIMIDVFRLTLLGYQPLKASSMVARLLEELSVKDKIKEDYIEKKFKKWKKLYGRGDFKQLVVDWLANEYNKNSFMEEFKKHLAPEELVSE